MHATHLPPSVSSGLPELDTIHGLVCEMLERTAALPQPGFGEAYAQLVRAIELDFRREEDLLERFQCTDARLHRAQPARVQAGLHHAAADLLRGDDGPARTALRNLQDWLPFHIATQDRHLVRFLRAARAKR